MPSRHPFDPSTYGRSFADVYDDWYGTSFDTAAAVDALLGLAHGGPVLELGVGTGRLAIPLADTGLRVVGIDASGEMLDRLDVLDIDGRILTVRGDMADVDAVLGAHDVDDRFSLAFCAFNTLLNLIDIETVTDCLRSTCARLLPDGCVVIEAFVPIDRATIPPRSLTPARVDSDAAVFIESTFDPLTAQLHGRHVEVRAGSVRVRPWTVLIVDLADLDRAAHTAGLELLERWSDWSGHAFTDDSTAHVSIFRRRH